jgi:hypothetical protein
MSSIMRRRSGVIDSLHRMSARQWVLSRLAQSLLVARGEVSLGLPLDGTTGRCDGLRGL